MPSLVPPVLPPGTLSTRQQPVLSTADGLTLRPWRLRDAAAVLDAFADPDIQRRHTHAIDSRDEAMTWIDQWATRWTAETDACWAVTGGEDVAVGRVALRAIDLFDGVAEVAYWLLPSVRGRGIVARATDAMSRWAFAELGLHRLFLQHSTLNPASCRVAEKAGFVAEGTARSALLHTDGWHDMHLHGRIAGDG